MLILGGGVLFMQLSCSPPTPETPDVILLHTGRLRGNIYPLSLQEIAPLQHYPYLVSYIKSVRDEAARTGARVVLLDLGDSLQGSFASYATDSANVATYFNEAAYDAILLGNLDNQVAPHQLERIHAVKLSPFLGADGRGALAGTSVAARLDLPPTTRDPNPLSLFVVANFYGDTAVDEFPDRFPNSFGSLTQEVVPDRRPVAEILDELSMGHSLPENRLVLFSWMKFEAPENPPEEFLTQLREARVDAILAQRVYGSAQMDAWAAMEFSEWNPPVSQNILRQNGGFTIARMDLRRAGSQWKVLRQELVPMTANTASASEEAIALQEEFRADILRADREIIYCEFPVSEEALLRSCLAALTQFPAAQSVAYSPQSIRADLPEGPLSASRLFRAIPWTGPLIALEISAQQWEQAVRHNPGWTFWQKEQTKTEESEASEPSEASEKITLVTSHFFGAILMRQLDLPLDSSRVLAPSEFDFFSTQFSSGNFLAPPPDSPPAGWSSIPTSTP